jgi:hypothetical protein
MSYDRKIEYAAVLGWKRTEPTQIFQTHQEAEQHLIELKKLDPHGYTMSFRIHKRYVHGSGKGMWIPVK